MNNITIRDLRTQLSSESHPLHNAYMFMNGIGKGLIYIKSLLDPDKEHSPYASKMKNRNLTIGA